MPILTRFRNPISTEGPDPLNAPIDPRHIKCLELDTTTNSMITAINILTNLVPTLSQLTPIELAVSCQGKGAKVLGDLSDHTTIQVDPNNEPD